MSNFEPEKSEIVQAENKYLKDRVAALEQMVEEKQIEEARIRVSLPDVMVKVQQDMKDQIQNMQRNLEEKDSQLKAVMSE
jgi:coenzyme F420-reducing hydrogenase delta subunit